MKSPRRDTSGADELRPRPASSANSDREIGKSIDALIASLADLDAEQLRLQWRNHLGGTPPAHLPRWLLARALAQRIQIAALGDLNKATRRVITCAKVESEGDGNSDSGNRSRPFAPRDPKTREGVGLRPGAILVREWNGALQRVMVMEDGFAWNGETYRSLSQIAKSMTGTSWNGHRFFGLKRGSAGVGVLVEVGTKARTGAGAQVVIAHNASMRSLGDIAPSATSGRGEISKPSRRSS